MKSVLISIQPYWVFLIIAKIMGWNIPQRKTVEVRKNYPKAENWNKVVKIYCSKDKSSFSRIPKEYQPLMEQFLGKVIGEFVCDVIKPVHFNSLEKETICQLAIGNGNAEWYKGSCVSYIEAYRYLKGAKKAYAWHISDQKNYDEPKPLSGFHIPCREYERADPRCGNCDFYKTMGEYPAECACDGAKPVVRPPQSWCYVEEVQYGSLE